MLPCKFAGSQAFTRVDSVLFACHYCVTQRRDFRECDKAFRLKEVQSKPRIAPSMFGSIDAKSGGTLTLPGSTSHVGRSQVRPHLDRPNAPDAKVLPSNCTLASP